MTERPDPLRILVVEDDEEDFFITRVLLARAGSFKSELDWARTYEEGLEAIRAKPYDVCLVDYRLGAQTGLDLLREASERGAMAPMILLTGQGDLEVDLSAMSAGAADYLVKGQIDSQLLERSIRYAIERRRAEERIREQAALLDKARDAICAFDVNQCIIYWNKGAERLTGYAADEVVGRPMAEPPFGSDARKLAAAYAAVLEADEWNGEMNLRAKDGEPLVVESRWTLVRDAAGQPRSILVINTDVTERKQLEAHFLRAQRMESIGGLVGGIAHDLGNLLVPILLGIKVLQQKFGDDERVGRTLSMMQKSAQRGSDMVKQVLAFARGVEGERVPLNLRHVVYDVRKIVEETFPTSIELAVAVPESLKAVVGDATQLQQVIMNLCVNARDAMPEGGRLTIGAESRHFDAQDVRGFLDAQPGEYVVVTIADTGTGMPGHVVDKIFEPFFTTKPTGKGTGLGLSTVYSIVKSHGGFLDVTSVEGEGTTFRVCLPATDELEAEDEAPGEEGFQGNGELVLVVDDEEAILEATRETLEHEGFRVLTASNGREALRVFEAHAISVEAVVTDLMMPEMDGLATIKALKARRAELPIIAASGVPEDERARQALDAGARAFLSKPFTPERLVHALVEALGAAREAARETGASAAG